MKPAATMFDTFLTGVVFTKTGPALMLRFAHPESLGAVAMTGVGFGAEWVTTVMLQRAAYAVARASGKGYASRIEREPVTAYLDEGRALLGLRFQKTGVSVDFSRILLRPKDA